MKQMSKEINQLRNVVLPRHIETSTKVDDTNIPLPLPQTQRGELDRGRVSVLYDATEAKTSLKIATSSLSIFFVIMSICLTLES